MDENIEKLKADLDNAGINTYGYEEADIINAYAENEWLLAD